MCSSYSLLGLIRVGVLERCFSLFLQQQMEKGRKRSRQDFEKEKSPTNERKRCTVWKDHRSTLDELFFRDRDLIKRFV